MRVFCGEFPQLVSREALGDQAELGGVDLPSLGRRVLSQLTELKQDEPQLEVLYDKMYENFVEEVDAVDNGISQCDGEVRYSISTTLSAASAISTLTGTAPTRTPRLTHRFTHLTPESLAHIPADSSSEDLMLFKLF
ncbi:hypothetical protein G5714_011587 [Onychostoma macrolepis]|uniref:Uncharacterized protein n=1 Tax=Onychostoma macrolepis TaxID=369639 RepID=A0A7J6CL46_9TELE|nr:hypothetical protein G5714_011587 [Onychostoma macrolepis]